jgi:phosphoglycolate phosphatase
LYLTSFFSLSGSHPLNLLLFDIDGTLLRDGGAAGRAYNRAFEEQFSMLPAHVDKHGKTDPSISREIALATLGRELTSDETNRLNARYCELFPGYLEESEAFFVYPGVADLCMRLSGDGLYCLGIQTGNLESTARAKLGKAGLDSFFRFGGYGSDSADRTVLVQMAIERGRAISGRSGSGVIVIGDSPHDIFAGRASGAFTIGVATGKTTAPDLAAAGADAVVEDLTEASGIGEILEAAGGKN